MHDPDSDTLHPTPPATAAAPSRACLVIVFAAVLTSCDAGIVPAARLYAAGERLDPEFGGNGIVTTPVGPDAAYETANVIVLQPDGKLVVAGVAQGSVASGFDFALVRYNADGSLDTTFGGDGIVTTPVGPDRQGRYGVCTRPATRRQDRGRGGASADGGRRDFALVRYNADGTLDTTFGSGGIVTTTIGLAYNVSGAYALVLQPDGKLVAAGLAYMGEGRQTDFALARYTADGALDPTFGAGGGDGDGIVTTDVSPISSFDQASALVLQPDGKLVAGGLVTVNNSVDGTLTDTEQDFALARYNSDGSIDTSFGGGTVLTDVSPDFVDSTPSDNSQDTVNTLLVQSDGKIVAAGYAEKNTDGAATLDTTVAALTRYMADGSLDTGFGDSGIVRVDLNRGDFLMEQITSILQQPNGKLTAAGFVKDLSRNFLGAFNLDIGVIRLNPTGSLDSSFGTGGSIITDFSTADPSDSSEVSRALLLQPDDKFVAAGSVRKLGSTHFAVVRYVPIIQLVMPLLRK